MDGLLQFLVVHLHSMKLPLQLMVLQFHLLQVHLALLIFNKAEIVVGYGCRRDCCRRLPSQLFFFEFFKVLGSHTGCIFDQAKFLADLVPRRELQEPAGVAGFAVAVVADFCADIGQGCVVEVGLRIRLRIWLEMDTETVFGDIASAKPFCDDIDQRCVVVGLRIRFHIWLDNETETVYKTFAKPLVENLCVASIDYFRQIVASVLTNWIAFTNGEKCQHYYKNKLKHFINLSYSNRIPM